MGLHQFHFWQYLQSDHMDILNLNNFISMSKNYIASSSNLDYQVYIFQIEIDLEIHPTK